MLLAITLAEPWRGHGGYGGYRGGYGGYGGRGWYGRKRRSVDETSVSDDSHEDITPIDTDYLDPRFKRSAEPWGRGGWGRGRGGYGRGRGGYGRGRGWGK